MLAMTARMSSRVATATWTFIPVWISTSSMATTLAGSAMATTSVSSPSRATGTSSQRRATSGGQEVHGRHVQAILGEVQEVQAEPLGDGAGALLGRDHALIDEELVRRRAGVARGQHRRLDALTRGKAQIDDDLGEEAHRPPPAVAASPGVTAATSGPGGSGVMAGATAGAVAANSSRMSLVIGGSRARSSPCRAIWFA